MSSLSVDSVTAKSLSIVDAEGKQVAILTGASGGAGLWLTGPGGDLVAVYAIEGQTAIGIYDKESQKYDTKGIPLALTVAQGVAAVQFRDKDGNVHQVTLDDVKKAVDAHKT